MTMRFDVETFGYILSSGFAANWYTTAIPRPDTNWVGDPRPGWWSLDASGALGLVLHYLNSTMSIDGLKLPVQTSNDNEIENTTFNGWLSEHFIGSVIVFSSQADEVLGIDVTIVVRPNALGSWHDSHIAQGIYLSLCMKTPGHYYLVADTAFPQGTADIKGHIQAPLKIKVGINQICMVYMKHWQETDKDIKLWTRFEEMLSSKQRKKDRVACFHVVLEYK
ncbi:hypothetical protein PAXINDRAFT_157540 [Paxillus involutus ATCC 200175]|uniref:DDE Tnp4 domain-containing protein n=1 Tax=Paxillus involutus ATCC 200175 TaxID=664439 RepID=A0A0C9TJ23_PAXIN|nr:hypothetical protein PAXINDRAFT_157540 [Paxillus involutus ATCC 200175]